MPCQNDVTFLRVLNNLKGGENTARIYIPNDDVPDLIEALRVAAVFTKAHPATKKHTKKLNYLSKKIQEGMNEEGEEISPQKAVRNLMKTVYPKKNLKSDYR